MIVCKNLLRVVSKITQQNQALILKSSQKIKLNNQASLFHCPKNFFSSMQQNFFIFNLEKEPQLLKLELQYRSQQNISIFEQSIKASTGILDQMIIFKIFKVMQLSPYSHVSYQEFYDYVKNNVKRKSDNILLLLATVKERMAKHYKKQNNIEATIQCLEQALDTLQGCMVPPLLPYYSVYREYGLLQDELGNTEKAKQILTETVEILDDFVSHSDDNVSTNHYCKKQATAYNVLARIDHENSKKWIQKAVNIWEKYTDNKLTEIEYAKTVANNLKKELKEDKERGQAYYHFNLYKFQSKQMKDILKKAKQQANI